jgi:hypothetical protein
MAKRNSKRVSEQFADRMLKRVRAAPALLNLEEVEKAEHNFRGWGVTRRTTFALLSKSGSELIDIIENDLAAAVLFAQHLDSLGNYLEYLKSIVKMAEAVQGRLIVALANRVDMDGVFAEAKVMSASDVASPLALQ